MVGLILLTIKKHSPFKVIFHGVISLLSEVKTVFKALVFKKNKFFLYVLFCVYVRKISGDFYVKLAKNRAIMQKIVVLLFMTSFIIYI